MADKWADYLISRVDYNASETHIEQVEVHPDNGDSVGGGSTWKRSKVVESLEAGHTFMTIFDGSDGKWRKGAEVQIIHVGGEKYIRTDADATRKDNLESLPRF